MNKHHNFLLAYSILLAFFGCESLDDGGLKNSINVEHSPIIAKISTNEDKQATYLAEKFQSSYQHNKFSRIASMHLIA